MTEDTLVFRDLRQRNLEDQKKAAAEGYNGVLEMAVNELGKRVIQLELRVDELEGGQAGPVDEALDAPA